MSTTRNHRLSDAGASSPPDPPPQPAPYQGRLRNSPHQRKKRSVRRSLKFASEGSRRKTFPPVGKFEFNVNTNIEFWNNPPPPELADVTRRSLRLRKKNQFAITQISDSQSPLGNQSTSDQVLRSKSTDEQSSVHSDYGTASENSLYYFPNKVLFGSVPTSSTGLSNHRGEYKASRNSCHPSSTHSIGYASDLDDSMSNLSIDDVTRPHKVRRWNDEEIEQDGNSEWEDLPPNNTTHLNLVDIDLKKVRVCLKSSNGINMLVPLRGYEYVHTPSPSSSSGKRTNSISSRPRHYAHYDLRSRPGRPLLEDVLKITCYNISVSDSFLRKGLRIVQVSPVISLEPHEIRFCNFYPALVQIPLAIQPGSGDEVHCLHARHPVENLDQDCSNIQWKSFQAGKYSIRDGKVSFEISVFGLFVLIIRTKCPSRTRTIHSSTGGKLTIRDLPGVEVDFPKQATVEDKIKATARIMFDTEESVSEFLARNTASLTCTDSMVIDGEVGNLPLATPIIHLKPHGAEFLREPVMVSLPVPDYEEIMSLSAIKPVLTVWQSNTDANESSHWERLSVNYSISSVNDNGKTVTVITFPVTHFSFFKAVWETLSNCLNDARIGVLYYFVSFAMKCQANMEEYVIENKDVRRFGLEISVFQADKSWPQSSTYKYKVGQSDSKLIKPGILRVKIKSEYFEADVGAGEDPEMTAEEADFRGRDFVKQFACRFKVEHVIERGTFGKVVVTRSVSSRQEEQLAFKFNLQKHGNEGEIAPNEITPPTPPENDDGDDEWSIVALTELANNLLITDMDNWRVFAKQIGMTQVEIKEAKLKTEKEPFKKIVHYYKLRGGTAEEFVNAIYSCHRSLKIDGGCSPESKHSRSSNGSSGRGSMSSNNLRIDRNGHDSDTSGTQTSRDSGIPLGRKRSFPLAQRVPGPSKVNSITSSKLSKRRKLSVKSLDPLSSEVESSESDEASDGNLNRDTLATSMVSAATTKSMDDHFLRNDKTKLNDLFLWDISDVVNTANSPNCNWRALGRSLGMEESTLADIHNTHAGSGSRECIYQILISWRQKFPSKCTFGTLYCTLLKEGMNASAKRMATMERNRDV